MAHSYSRQVILGCKTCNQTFEASIWLIIDASERPDLIDRIRKDSIHKLTCPHCGEQGAIDEPLLIYMAEQLHPLIFSPARRTSVEQDQQLADQLLAKLHQSLGTSWEDKWLVDGLRSFPRKLLSQAIENLEEALEHLEQLQQNASIHSRSYLSTDLEGIITELSEPSHRDKTSQHIALCLRGLALLAHDDNPSLWAMLKGELGNNLAQNVLGNRGENLEQAIAAYHDALTVRTRETMPVEWANTLNNLANCYVDRIRGERAENIEQAIAAYHDALTVRTRETMPTEWAQTMNNLATAYRNRIRGDRADNLEQAIITFQAVLTVMTRETMPTEWAQTVNNLATAFAERIRGERAENIEQAITLCQEALALRDRDIMPIDWATTMNNLANCYVDRIRGERAENIEQAIAAYRDILTVMTRETMPTEWVQAINNLAIAYTERIRGERADNLERAIAAYRDALTIMTCETMPIDWATTTINLATTYIDRIDGNRAENIEQAITSYRDALTIMTREAMPVEWATIMMNLANAYIERIRGERAENIEQAIAFCQSALTVMTREAMPIDWANTMINLANAYTERIRGERAENIEQAIAAYRNALTIMTREAMPIEWAQTLNNLAVIYAERIRGERAENIEQAIAAYRNALTIMTRQSLPADYRRLQRNLGNLYFNENLWSDAATVYAEASIASNELFETAFTDVGRRAEIGETARLYVRTAYTLLKLGQPSAAFIQLEKGKTRLLAEVLALNDTKLIDLPEHDWITLQTWQQRIRELEAEYRLTPETPSRRDNQRLATLLEEARMRLHQQIDLIRQFYPRFMSLELDLPDILSIIPEQAALVAPFFTSQGSAVFVVPYGVKNITEEHVVRLDEFKTDNLNAILRGTEDSPGWLRAYSIYRSTRNLQEWSDYVEQFTKRLWDIFLSHINTRLSTLQVKQVILLPQGGLGLLPLHAAWRIENSVRRYFLDDYEVLYAPSTYALGAAKQRLSTMNGQSALIVGVSNYRKLSPLPYVPTEIEAVAEHFHTKPLLEMNPNRQAILENAEGKTYLHFSCHGSFAWGNDPLASSLHLSDEEVLSLADIVGKLDLYAARLVTLSACETGIIDVSRSPDEYIGFPAGFMQAGALGVVSSLWTVEDRSTALLMERFYRYHLGNRLQPAAALRAAQKWLRDLSRKELGTYYESFIRMNEKEAFEEFSKIVLSGDPDDKPYTSPCFWAAFTYSGI